MTTTTLLGVQVKRLLSNLPEHGSRHLSEIETDLAQTSFLLNGAIEKLGASFIAIHAAMEAQQELVDALLSGTAPTPEMVEKLKAGRNEINLHVNAAVTGLQFQDMTSQLIGRTVTRVHGMLDVLDGIAASAADMPTESSTDGVVAVLDDVNKMLEERSETLDNALWKAVSQTHMDSGDVELF
jgi:hypothetical protein